ncbi:MAG: hypothetical protein JWM89_1529 [Acidimicrobiales bacterium]|nr:hypothetical protein [Acidimicrobiales bacterium]
MNKLNMKLAFGAAISTLVVGFATVAGATSGDPGTLVTGALQDWSDQAVAMIPAALAAGLALFGVAVLIRFGKRIFKAAQ